MGDEEWIAATQEGLGKLIAKPKMTEKYLKKPPFRFLHDIIMEVQRTTNFGNGLFTPEESDAQSMSDKSAKVDFLNKAISVVSFALGEKIDVSANKIVAGLEADKTNLWLQKLHIAATTAVDKSEEAVQRVLSGETVAAPKKKKPKEEEPSEKPPETTGGGEDGQTAAADEEAKKEEDKRRRAERKKREEEKKRRAEEEAAAANNAPAPETAVPAHSDEDAEAERKKKKEEERARRHEEKKRQKAEEEERARQQAEAEALQQQQQQAAQEAQLQQQQYEQQLQMQQQAEDEQRRLLAAQQQQQLMPEEPPQDIMQSAPGSANQGTRPVQEPVSAEEMQAMMAQQQMGGGEDVAGMQPGKVERPRTAGRKPPKVTSKVKTSTDEPGVTQAAPPPNIIAEGQKDDDDEDMFEDQQAPGLMAMPGIKADSSEPHGKLVADILNEKQRAEEKERLRKEEEDTREEVEDPSQKGIKMGKLRRKKDQVGSYTEIDTVKLSEQIQQLCQAANPLGKSIDLVHQDIANMGKELDQWKNEYREASELYQQQLKLTDEQLQPLYQKIAELDDKIAEQKTKIRNSRSRISKSDLKIQGLLESVVMAK